MTNCHHTVPFLNRDLDGDNLKSIPIINNLTWKIVPGGSQSRLNGTMEEATNGCRSSKVIPIKVQFLCPIFTLQMF